MDKSNTNFYSMNEFCEKKFDRLDKRTNGQAFLTAKDAKFIAKSAKAFNRKSYFVTHFIAKRIFQFNQKKTA